MNHSFGPALRVAREARNLSLRDLAPLVGRTHSWLALVEQNRLAPSEGLVRRLAEVLGAPELIDAAGILPEDVLGFLRANPQVVQQLRTSLSQSA